MSTVVTTVSLLRPDRAIARVNERAALAAVILLALGITGLPYLYGYLSAPSDKQFMGILLDTPDTAQYLSWARESSHSFLIQNMLTSEQEAPVYFNLFWLVVGRSAAALGIGLAEAAQLIRPFAGALYMGAIAWVVGRMTRNRAQRWTASLVAILGGGLGWLLVVQKYATRGDVVAPLTLYVTEPNTFLTVMAFPHQAMAGGLLVLVLGLAARALERQSFAVAIAAGALGLLLGAQHGYDLVIVYAVVGVVALLLAWRDRPDGSLRPLLLAAAICAPSVPAALYLFLMTRLSPVWRSALAQYGNAGVYTPTPPGVVVLMGLPLVLALAGAPFLMNASVRQAARKVLAGPPTELLLWAWLVVGGLLLYIPTDFQIKMLAGWQVPVAIVGTRVLFDRIVPALERHRLLAARTARGLAAAILVAAVLPTNVYLLAWRFVDLGRHGYPYFLPRDETAALQWLDDHAASTDVVLSSQGAGQYIPALTGTHAFLAHWAMTLDYYTRERQVAAFFDPSVPDAYRRALLETFGVRYVFFSAQERALGGYDPERAPFLARAYESPAASVYAVRLDHRDESTG